MSIENAFARLADEVWDDPDLMEDIALLRAEMARLQSQPKAVEEGAGDGKRLTRRLESAYRKGARDALKQASDAMVGLVSTEYGFVTPMSRAYTEQAKGILAKMPLPEAGELE